MKTFALVIALMLFYQDNFCQKPLMAPVIPSRSSDSPTSIKNFDHDIALIKPLINVNDSNGGYYQEYWYFSFHSMYCGATVKNTGNVASTHVFLEMKIFDNSNSYLHSFFSDTIATLNPGETQTINIPGQLGFQQWIGNSTIDHMVFLARSDSLDANPADNQQTVPFPVLTFYDWTLVARSVNPIGTRVIGQPGGFQSGDFIGFTCNTDSSWHRAYYLKCYLKAPWTEPIGITAMLYENRRMVDSIAVMLPSPPQSGWVFSNPFFFTALQPDSTYYAGIKFTLPAGGSFSLGSDTSVYHHFSKESIAQVNGNWTSLDFIPVMELVCDPEGIAEKVNNGPVVFPNPASSELYVENVRDAKVELFDLAGRLLLTDMQTSPDRKLDVSGFPSGIYLLRITSKERTIGQKVVIRDIQD